MRFSLVVHVSGVMVRLFGAMFAAPLAVALFYREYSDAAGFAIAAVVTVTLGHLMRRAGGSSAEDAVEGMRRVEGLAVVSGGCFSRIWPPFPTPGRASARSTRCSNRCPA